MYGSLRDHPEGIFIVTLYGNDDELVRLYELLECNEDKDSTAALAELVERVKQRRLAELGQ